MTFLRPTLSALIDRIAADLATRMPGADSRLRRSALDVIGRTHAGATHGLYGYLDQIAKAVLPETAEGGDLDRRASTWGIIRKGATGAAGTLSLAGVDGSIVPAGAILQRIDGVRYRTRQDAVIAAGVAIVAVEATDAGLTTAVPAGGQLTFVSPVSGVQAIATTAAGLTGAADEEDDTALRTRLLDRIRTPPRGGAAADWTAWALEVAGVTRAWSYPNWMGPGTVGLTFVHDGREDIIPAAGDIEIMIDHIEPLRPVCSQAIIFAPTERVVNIAIRLSPDTVAVRSAILAELADMFAREAAPGGTIYKSRLNEAVSQAAGEFDHTIVSPAGNVVAMPGALPVLGAVTWA